MAYRRLALESLVVNRANDRHGELENETAAIAWLFYNHEPHMRNLAKDIVEAGQLYEAPLVFPDEDTFIVFDGNRRVTCLKLLFDPRRAPTVELREFFEQLTTKCGSSLPEHIECQVETDRDQIDEILFRRHTGGQAGVGQINWDDRMKSNFVNRTGKASGVNLAEDIERRLQGSNLPRISKKIPWSTMNRLLSAEAFRNRVGLSVSRGRVELTHEEPVVLRALHRIASDLANRRKVLNDVWDVDGKRGYLNQLAQEGVLPRPEHALQTPVTAVPSEKATVRTRPPPKPQRRINLIPNAPYPIAWAGRLQRHRAIWEELQFHLRLSEHPNAISVLLRVLLELSLENYIQQVDLTTIKPNDSLAKRTLRIAEDLHSKGKINRKYLEGISKFPQYDALISADTLNRYVHSPNFAPSPEHLTALWDALAELIVLCLSA
jgi:hypothetical protein